MVLSVVFYAILKIMKIAIQGIKGSFHSQAARELFTGYEYTLVECQNFHDVFESVQKDEAGYGVVAVENSLHGTINPVYRLLAEQKLQVCGEVRLSISLYLIGHDNGGLDMINIPLTKVYSQREALNQCEDWLRTNLSNAQIVEASDTAEAVKDAVEAKSYEHVAIGSRESARLYNGEVIAGPVNDEAENYTRFFVITKKPQEVPDANRTSIILTENSDKAGILYEALGLFAKHNINLSKLHSQPRPGKRRLYSFYIDFDQSLAHATEVGLIDELRNIGWKVTILGSYKAGDTID